MLYKKVRSNLCGARFLAAVLILAPWSVPASQTLGPFAVTNVSDALTRAYNEQNVDMLHGLLAPAVQARYSPGAVKTALALCRALTGDILRLSTPSWGARSYGFFGLYAETGVFDMVLEIDQAERIVYWVITHDVTAKEQQCRLGMTADVRQSQEDAQ